MLEDGARALKGGTTGSDALLTRADAFNGRKQPGEAATFYEQALQSGGDSWPHRTRTIESLVMALMFAGKRDASSPRYHQI